MFTATAGANLHAGVDFSLILVDSNTLIMQCIEDNLSIWHLHTAVDFDDVVTPFIKISTPIISTWHVASAINMLVSSLVFKLASQ